ncbi:MAG: LEPR-XLL domain-containing protein [Planctomycetes bacterium]|nr:LEPR-XLL domain-containing protein [Planctomycetota bacterium]
MRTRRGHLTIESLEPRLLLAASSPGVELFSTSPALFVENHGQWADPSVHYAFHGLGGKISFTDTGPIFQLFASSPLPLDPSSPLPLGEGRVRGDIEGSTSSESPHPNPLPEGEGAAIQATQFSVTFDGANPVAPTGLSRSESLFNYFIGDQATWRSNVASYETVAYQGLYGSASLRDASESAPEGRATSGIDLLISGRRDSLKYEFRVAPGADPSQIQITYTGISGLSIAADGSLHVALPDGFGEMIDDAPVITLVQDSS